MRTPLGRGELCWTGSRTTTTPPRRLATSATIRSLRLSRTTRTVTVRPADPDTASSCQPPVSPWAIPLTRHSPGKASQPLDRARACCPRFGRSRQRPASRRVPTVSESADSVTVFAHPAGIGRGCSRAGNPCDGLPGHPTPRPPVCWPRDRVAANPSLQTRRCLRPASPPAGRQRCASAGLDHSDSPYSLLEAPLGLVQARADLEAQASVGLPPALYPTRAYSAGRSRATRMSVGGAGGLSSAECGGPLLSAH
jgi:hypothetical protein